MTYIFFLKSANVYGLNQMPFLIQTSHLNLLKRGHHYATPPRTKERITIRKSVQYQTGIKLEFIFLDKLSIRRQWLPETINWSSAQVRTALGYFWFITAPHWAKYTKVRLNLRLTVVMLLQLDGQSCWFSFKIKVFEWWVVRDSNARPSH